MILFCGFTIKPPIVSAIVVVQLNLNGLTQILCSQNLCLDAFARTVPADKMGVHLAFRLWLGDSDVGVIVMLVTL